MYDGTLGTKGPWEALVTFQQMLVLADRVGHVDMTAPAISRRSTIPLEIIEKGLRELEEPDPESRSPAAEGRRIVRLDEGRSWGWSIVNYEHYRKIRTQEERRDYHRDYARRRRAKAKNIVNTSQHVNTEYTESTNSSKQNAVSSKQLNPCSSATPNERVGPFISELQARSFDEFWKFYWRRVAKKEAQKAYAKGVKSTKAHQKVMAALNQQAPQMLTREPDKRPHPATWLNQERWNDEPETQSTPKQQKTLREELAEL